MIMFYFLKINSFNDSVVFILNWLYSFYVCTKAKQTITNSLDRKVKHTEKLCQLVLSNILAKKMSL